MVLDEQSYLSSHIFSVVRYLVSASTTYGQTESFWEDRGSPMLDKISFKVFPQGYIFKTWYDGKTTQELVVTSLNETHGQLDRRRN